MCFTGSVWFWAPSVHACIKALSQLNSICLLQSFLFLCQEGISKALMRRLKPWAGFAKICATFSALLGGNMDWITKMEFYQPASKAYCRQEKAALGLQWPRNEVLWVSLFCVFHFLWLGNTVLIVDRQTQEQHPQFLLHCARKKNSFEGPQLDSVLIQNTAQCWRNEESEFKLMEWCFAQLLLKGASGVNLMECMGLCAGQHLLNRCVHCRDPGGKETMHFHPFSQSISGRANCWTDCGASSTLSGRSEIDFTNISCVPGGLMRTRWTQRRIDSGLALLQNLITLILQKLICILQCWC